MTPKFISLILIFSLLSGVALSQTPTGGGSIPGGTLLERADFLLQNNRYEEAIVMLDEAAKKEPTNADIRYRKATTFMALTKLKDATKELEEAVKINPNYYQAYEILGNIYSQVRQVSKAVENYQKAYDTDPNAENKLSYKFAILDLMQKTGTLADAKPHIEDAKKVLGEDNFDLKFYEVLYLNETDQYEQAAQIMSELIKEIQPMPGNEIYYYQYGLALHKLEKYKEAEEVLKNADGGPFRAKLKQFTPEYYFSLANCYFLVYEYNEADKFNNIALKLNPAFQQSLELQKKLAVIKSENKKYIEALENELKQIKDKPTFQEKQKSITKVYYQTGDYQKVVLTTKEYLKDNPTDLEMIFLEAVAENKLSIFADAANILSKVVENPKITPQLKVSFYFTLGLIYKNMKDYTKAEEAFKKAGVGPFSYAARYEYDMVHKLRHAAGQDSNDETQMDEEGEDEGDEGGKKE
ncbi:MAG: hypothetical protein OHK0038_19530 [Flammeovirgaceae bacterium]